MPPEAPPAAEPDTELAGEESSDAPEPAPPPGPSPAEIQKAIGYLYAASDQGDPAAQLELAKLMYAGRYIGKDINGAAEIFETLAGQNNADAAYYVGQMYFTGTGRQQNGYQAITWTRKAATNGSVLGQRALGQLYINGYETVGKDRIEADRWLTAAAQNGDEASARLLQMMREGAYVPAGDLTALLPAGDIVRASEAAMQGIEMARARVARGEPLIQPTSVSWGDGDYDGKPDGQTTVTPLQSGGSCYVIEHVSFIEGKNVRREEQVCEASDGSFQSTI